MKMLTQIRQLLVPMLLLLLVSGCGGGGGASTTIDPGSGVPVADAGTKQNVVVDNQVTLNGTASRDPDRELLTYSWTLTTRPAGSTATLQEPHSPTPVFVADVPGTYVATLVVSDGRHDSPPVSVTIVVASSNAAPVAYAGPAQSVVVGDTVLLSGASSSDANGDRLTYRWSLDSKPGTSAARLADATTPTQSFVADVAGSYVASLVVNDGKVDSSPSTVTITVAAGNAAPVANAGPAQMVLAGATVNLSGFGSSDANGDRLTFNWTMQSRPAGSAAVLINPGLGQPSFVADAAGVYVVALTVNDGKVDSAPATVTVTATAPGSPIDLLTSPASIGAGANIGGIVLADMNADGKPDIVLGTSNGVGVLLGNGAGGYSPMAVYPVAAGAAGEVLAGDFNGDGKLDVVVGGGMRYLPPPLLNYAQFSVLLGDGQGGLGSAGSFDAGGYQASQYALSDMDGDGRPDLLFSAAAYHAGGALWIGRGDGVGGFGNWTSPIANPNFAGVSAVAGDINADGVPDLVALDPGNVASSLRVLRGTGGGAFAPMVSVTLPAYYSARALRDFNGDGRLDLLSAGGSGGISVFAGDGSGGFGTALASSCYAGPWALADLNRDGKVDLVSTLGDTAATLSVCLGDGAGRFAASSPLRTAGAGIALVAVGDINGDGKPDVVTVNADKVSLSVYLGK